MKTLKNLLIYPIIAGIVLLGGACKQKSKKIFEEETKVEEIYPEAKEISDIELLNNSGTLYENYSAELEKTGGKTKVDILAGKENIRDSTIGIYYKISQTAYHYIKAADIIFVSHTKNKRNNCYFMGSDIWLNCRDIDGDKNEDILVAGVLKGDRDSISVYSTNKTNDKLTKFSKPVLLGKFPVPFAGNLEIKMEDYNSDGKIDFSYKVVKEELARAYLINKGNNFFEYAMPIRNLDARK